MNMIRNGGFESGDMTFWTISGGGTVTIDDTNPKYGIYCLKAVASYGTAAIALNNDYVEVDVLQPVYASIWVKPSAQSDIALIIYEYDANLDQVGMTEHKLRSTTANHYQMVTMPIVGANTVYARVGIKCGAVMGLSDVYIDGVVLSTISHEKGSVVTSQIAELANLTGSGDTSGTPAHLMGFGSYQAHLNCTVCTGTAPTVDVSVCELDYYGREIVLGSFTQFNAVGGETISINPPLGNGMYVKYTEGGVWTEVDMVIAVTGAR